MTEALIAVVRRSRMGRQHKRAKPSVKARVQPKEQLTIGQANKRAEQERYSWKGGLTRVKNIPENFKEED